MKIAFISGARSDYGPIKRILKEISINRDIDLTIIAHGLHFIQSFGNTIEEIREDNFGNIIEIPTLNNDYSKASEYYQTFNAIFKHLNESSYDFVIILGDRLESYAAALAAHFAKNIIIHFGGGHRTNGAVDDIYRFNITNLSNYHIVTTKQAFDTLITLPTIKKDNVYLVGSCSVDAIKEFLKFPVPITKYIPDLKTNYALMTFHPVTLVNEPLVEIMKLSIELILSKGFDVVITYPNNDENSQDIINFINKVNNINGVFIMPHLGTQGYYSAINDSSFVIGNSSSGLIEAPYFNKQVINIGSRQEGRTIDKSVDTVSANTDKVLDLLNFHFHNGWRSNTCENLYGNGVATQKFISILHEISKNMKV